MVTKRKPGRPRKNPEPRKFGQRLIKAAKEAQTQMQPRKRGRPPKNPVTDISVGYVPLSITETANSDWQPSTGPSNYVYRRGTNGDHYIDLEISRVATKADAERLLNILNGQG